MGGMFYKSSPEMSGSSFVWCSYFDSLMLYNFNSRQLYNPLDKGLRNSLQQQGPTPKIVAQAPGSDYTFVLLYSTFDTRVNVYEHTKNFRQAYSSGSMEKNHGFKKVIFSETLQYAVVPTENCARYMYNVLDYSRLQIIKKSKSKWKSDDEICLKDISINAEGTRLASFDSLGVFHLADFCQDEFILSWTLKKLESSNSKCEWNPVPGSGVVALHCTAMNLNFFDCETQKFFSQETIAVDPQDSTFDWKNEGNLLAVANQRCAKIFDLRVNKVVRSFVGNQKRNLALEAVLIIFGTVYTHNVKWSHDGKFLATSTSSTVKVFDFGTGKALFQREGCGNMSSICFLS